MYSLYPNYLTNLSFCSCMVLEITALVILLIARQYARLKSMGGALLAFASKAMFALPAVVVLSLLARTMHPLTLQPYMYTIGAPLSCLLLDLCMHVE
jgi:hypothetical protein